VSRAGASALAELAAARLPCLLVPFPAAAENHQFFNARIYAMSGAARLLEQKDSTPEKMAATLAELVEDDPVRSKMNAALALWHYPKSAEQIAASILRWCGPAAETSAAGRPAAILSRRRADPKDLPAA
jgi:UDP-N-acetylglucosamine--N-acetylmuramyl-(pentapeptide) pyrophosphoryl-undecaprenol N-acetylglucosamine transferase